MAYYNTKNWQSTYQKRLDLYLGGPTITQYLTKHPYETLDEFAQRKQVYSYSNELKKIINFYVFQIFNVKPVINGLTPQQEMELVFFDPNLQQYRDIWAFSEEVLRYFAALGEVFIVRIDPDISHSEYMVCLPTNSYKQLVQGGLYQYVLKAGPVNAYTTYVITELVGGGYTVSTNGSQAVEVTYRPVYDIFIDENADGLAESVIGDAVSLQETILHYESFLNYKFIYGSFDLIVLADDDASFAKYNTEMSGLSDNKTDFPIPKRVMYSQPGSTPTVLSVDVDFIKQMQDRLNELKDSIRELSSQRLHEAYQQSGISKAMDEHNATIPLRYLSDFIERLLTEILEDKFNTDVDVVFDKNFNIYSDIIKLEGIQNTMEKVTNPNALNFLEEEMVVLSLKYILSDDQIKLLRGFYDESTTTLIDPNEPVELMDDIEDDETLETIEVPNGR